MADTFASSGTLALVCALLLPAWAMAGGTTDATGASSACGQPIQVAADAATTATLGSAPVDGPALSQGTWTRMASAPFGSEYEPVVWTGTRMIAVDSDTGRTATYRPDRDRWREVSAAPRSFEITAPSVWTGSELIIVELAADGSRLGGLAFHAGTDEWRELATQPIDPDGGRDHALADALWTGSHVVVVDALGLLAAYDPAVDCWIQLGDVPGGPWAWHLYPADGTLLVESRRWGAPVEIRAYDPVRQTWSEPSIGSLHRDAAEDGGHPVDGRLAYVSWRRDNGVDGGSNAGFDPVAMTWATFEHDCGTAASGTIAVDHLLIASDGRRVLDGRTLECFDLPAPPRDLNGTERLLWTGSELIAWSGIRSLPEAPRRGGLILRPVEPE